MGMGFDSQCDFAPPTIWLGLILCSWMDWVLIIPFAGKNIIVRLNGCLVDYILCLEELGSLLLEG